MGMLIVMEILRAIIFIIKIIIIKILSSPRMIKDFFLKVKRKIMTIIREIQGPGKKIIIIILIKLAEIA